MVSKVRNVRLGVFSGGGCHHPNIIILHCVTNLIFKFKNSRYVSVFHRLYSILCLSIWLDKQLHLLNNISVKMESLRTAFSSGPEEDSLLGSVRFCLQF